MDEITINGVARHGPQSAGQTLLTYLREAGLTGAKPACGEGACGACTVLIDGEAVRSCRTPAEAAVGHAVRTIEGLSADGGLHAVQQAFLDEGAIQCGYCTPGMVLAAVALLERETAPVRSRSCRAGRPHLPLRRISTDRARGDAGGERTGRRAEPRRSGAAASADGLGRRPVAPWDLTPMEERDYFRLLGDGLVVVEEPAAAAPAGRPAFVMSGGAWLHVDPDGPVTAFTGKVELGQDAAPRWRCSSPRSSTWLRVPSAS